MATVERIEPGYTAWTPSVAGIKTETETYVGRHRKPGGVRGMAVYRFFYRARHRRT